MLIAKSMNGDRRRAAFTLIETIVTVGILAVIASFVIPSVIQRVGVGDPVKAQNDLTSVRTAIETFATDSKAGFPHQISSLTAKPVTATSRLIDSAGMTLKQVAAWNGPYLGATISVAPADSLATGFTAYIMNFLERYDITNNVPEHNAAGTANSTFVLTSTLFAGVQVHGLTPNHAKTLNALIDGPGDPNQLDGSNTTGRFRFAAPAGGLVIAFYLAAPITQ
ncbi:MAG: prepilin-type N-terminal cleavage/methylation domain-containing protein [bacterium]